MASPKRSLSASGEPRIPRVAMLVDTSTSWGRRIIHGVSNYVHKHGPWQLFVEARGMEERLRVPPGWQGDGVIARVNNLAMSKELQALRVPVVNVSGIQLSRMCFPQVTTNVKEVADLALAHLVERGFQHFAYFSVLGVSYVGTQKDAFVEAVRKRGKECSVYSVKAQSGAEPNWNLDLARLGEWIKELPKPVGLLTWNASGGREILYACYLAGTSRPARWQA